MVDFCTTREVARILEVKPATLRKMISDNRLIAPSKFGLILAWTQEDISRAAKLLGRYQIANGRFIAPA